MSVCLHSYIFDSCIGFDIWIIQLYLRHTFKFLLVYFDLRAQLFRIIDVFCECACACAFVCVCLCIECACVCCRNTTSVLMCVHACPYHFCRCKGFLNACVQDAWMNAYWDALDMHFWRRPCIHIVSRPLLVLLTSLCWERVDFYVCTCRHVSKYTYVCIYTCLRTCLRVYMYTYNLHICVYTHISTFICTPCAYADMCSNTQMFVYFRLYLHIYVYTCVRIYRYTRMKKSNYIKKSFILQEVNNLAWELILILLSSEPSSFD